jgi:hypothetical protein
MILTVLGAVSFVQKNSLLFYRLELTKFFWTVQSLNWCITAECIEYAERGCVGDQPHQSSQRAGLSSGESTLNGGRCYGWLSAQPRSDVHCAGPVQTLPVTRCSSIVS